MPSSGSVGGGNIDMELLLDRLLSASTPTDCLDSLEGLSDLCRLRRPSPKSDPKTLRPSEAEALRTARAEAETEEEDRQASCADALVGNGRALGALCGLIASSTLSSAGSNGGGGGGGTDDGMEVEGGDAAACELLLAALPPPPAPPPVSSGATSLASSGATTEALVAQRRRKRRAEHVSKSLLRFHEDYTAEQRRGGVVDDAPLPALVPSLLDCLCAQQSANDGGNNGPSVYARVLSLQALQSLLSASPGALRERLVAAPDGINRLVDLLGSGSGGTGASSPVDMVPEEVRNEALLFLTSLASSSSVLARLVAFSEGYDRALRIAAESLGPINVDGVGSTAGGGGSQSAAVATDCLELCLAMARGDDVARELFLGGGDGRGNLDGLARMMDLRGGERFGDEERNVWWENELKERRRKERKAKKNDATSAANSAAAAVPAEKAEKKAAKRKGGKRGKRREEEDDDLDDILRGASGASAPKAVASKKNAEGATTDDDARGESSTTTTYEPQGPPTPYLTPNEARVVDLALDLLLVLLLDGDHNDGGPSRSPSDASRSKRRGRARAVAAHGELPRYVLDCAMYTLPPPGVDYVSAVPPPGLQRKALAATAALGSLGDTVLSEEERNAGMGESRGEGDGDDAETKKKEERDAARRRREAEEESAIRTRLLFETFPVYLRGRVTAMDRLMFLCCTGAYSPKPASSDDDFLEDDERPEAVASLLSSCSVAAFRSCLPPEVAMSVALHALAPPPPSDDADVQGAPPPPPMEPSVVTRLATTLADNLRFLESRHQDDGDETITPEAAIDIQRACVGASGAAGALGVFLTGGEGDATREMLLRLPAPVPPRLPTPSADDGAALTAPPAVEEEEEERSGGTLIDLVLRHVATVCDPDASSVGLENGASVRSSTAYVTASLLRLLCEWVVGMPRAASEVLSSPSSVSVAAWLRSSKKRGKGSGSSPSPSLGAADAIPALSGLLLGLCLEYASSDPSSSSLGDGGGAAHVLDRAAIMNVIQAVGVGRYLATIDEFRTRPLPLPLCAGTERSAAERRAFARWYGGNVLTVRRRVVTLLAGGGGGGGTGGEEDDSDGEEGADIGGGGDAPSLRSLRRMVTDQAREMEDLRAELEESSCAVAARTAQVKELRRVAELGTSAEANDMIAEYTEKLAELERTKSSLKKEAERSAREAEEAVAAKEREAESVREELREAREAIEEMRRDNRTLSEEMSGLSAAYNSLEARYQDVGGGDDDDGHDGNHSDTPAAAGEDAAESGGAPGGEAAAEDGRDDVGKSSRRQREVERSLQEENARLREDVRAANEWMSMAVERMEEMGNENATLASELEEARTREVSRVAAEVGNAREEAEALRREAEAVREGAEAARASSEAEAREKDEEIARQRELVRRLEERVEEAERSPAEEASSSASEEQQQQARELTSLRQANKDAQEWMASAVAHVDMLTKQVGEKDARLEELARELEIASEDARTRSSAAGDAEFAELESSLSAVASERDEAKVSLAEASEEASALREANGELRQMVDNARARHSSEREALRTELDQAKAEIAVLEDSRSQGDLSKEETLQTELERIRAEHAALKDSRAQEDSSETETLRTELERVRAEHAALEDSRAQDSSEKEALQTEIDQVNAEIGTLKSTLAEFQSWSETAQGRLAEVEATLQETEAERDRLKVQLEEASGGVESSPRDLDRIASLEEQICEKEGQLERMQDQLIEDAEEREADNEKLLDDLRAERQRVEESTRREEASSAAVDALSRDKDALSSALAAKQAEIDSASAGRSDANARAEEAERRISELEAAKASAEAQVDRLTVFQDEGKGDLDDQIVAVTAERNQLQSELDDVTEDYEETRNSLECMSMENGNLIARTRALEQDNKSLEYQYTESRDKIQEMNDLLVAANDDKLTLQEALEVMKIENEETVQLWQDKVQALEDDVQSLGKQLKDQEKEAAEAIALWETRCSTLEGSGESVTEQREEKAQALQSDVTSLENQLVQQEKEASDAIALWETRCSSLEESAGDVAKQWEERVQSLERDMFSLETQLEQQEKEAAEAIALWETRCSALEESGGDVILQWEEKVQSLEGDVASLEEQLVENAKDSSEAIEKWEARCTELDNSLGSTKAKIEIMSEQNQLLEGKLATKMSQIDELNREIEKHAEAIDGAQLQMKEKDDALTTSDEQVSELANELLEAQTQASEAVSLWEARCNTLSEEGMQLQANISELEGAIQEQENGANEVIAQWEARCATLNEKVEELELQLIDNENDETIAELKAEVTSLTTELESIKADNKRTHAHLDEAKDSLVLRECEWEDKESSYSSTIELLKKEKDDALASSDEQVSELAKELQETQTQATDAISLWEERCATLNEERIHIEANISELEGAIQEQESGANDAIAQWEARCATLNERIEDLESEIASNDINTTVAELKAEIKSLTAKLEANKIEKERTQENLKETKKLLALREGEWEKKEATLTSSVEDLEGRCAMQQKKSDEGKSLLDNLNDKHSVLEDENANLLQEMKVALKESEESQSVVLELKEELRHAKEELQSFATDQFTVKATEMATQALRQQMVEIRTQYAVDQDALTSEREGRQVAEEQVSRLKSELACLAQATEYNEDVDVHVRKIAKKVSDENVKAERKEMEELRSTLERLREELGSCRWNNTESQEKAANARLQMSILEQEVSAAKIDLQLMEEAMEELENSKIEMSVSLEYRIEALENERLLAEQSYDEEINGIKGELAHANQEKDNLAHKLEQSEKANAALVYSTSHDGLGGKESQSEVIKLQLERAQLLAKINEMGADLERRVREAVAAQASSSEAELIVEKQSRLSVESSLSDAMSKLDEAKSQLADQTANNRDSGVAEKVVQDLGSSLNDIRQANEDLVNKLELLQTNSDTADKENKSTIDDLGEKLRKAEARLRLKDRETRFEAAIASEIAHLRANTPASSNGNPKQSHSIVLRGLDQNIRPSSLFDEGKDSIDRNSAYIIEMYDYVVELKNSITEERQMYKDLLAEHDDLLALLGQTGMVEGMQFSVCE